MNLRRRLEDQQTAVSEFKEALEIIQTKPKYKPAPGTIAPLDILSAKLAELQDEKQRAEHLKLAQQSLQEAQAALAELEQQWASLQAAATAAEQEITQVIEAFNAASSQLADAASRLKELQRQHSGVFKDVHGHGDLLRGTSAIEFVPVAKWLGNSVLLESQRLEAYQPNSSPFAA